MVTSTYFLHWSDTCAGHWYLPSIIRARISPAPPYAKGEWPVMSMNRMTPKLHTSEGATNTQWREADETGGRR